MAIERVYTTIYHVDDCERSVAFYRDALGLKPLYVERGWVEFQVGTGGRIALHPRHPRDPADVTQVSLQVRDIDATLQELTGRGAHLVEPVRREDFGAIATVADPSGNVIGLYEPR
jgi:predicted enzyme related to lactoylglutathione lyase